MINKTKTISFWAPFFMVLITIIAISACIPFEPVVYVHIRTLDVENISDNSAECGGWVEVTGGSWLEDPDFELYYCGICWESDNTLPTDNCTSELYSEYQFIHVMDSLTPGTEYYVRAYIESTMGTTWGETKQFITSATTTPIVVTNAATSVGETSAILNGDVTSDGGTFVSDRGFYYGYMAGPDTIGTMISAGNGTGSFTSALTSLIPGTSYYVRAYATNSAGTAYGDKLSFTTTSIPIPTVTDYDGNVYQVVQIGDQVWMAENLRSSHYADGTSIPYIPGSDIWMQLNYKSNTSKAFCWYDNNASVAEIYGNLYTWAAAMNGASSSNSNPSEIQGVCPNGWHIPSDNEWQELEINLGMNQFAADTFYFRGTNEGGKLKDTIEFWETPNTGATNESNFSALPAGIRNSGGYFSSIQEITLFWTSTKFDISNALTRMLVYDNAQIYRDSTISSSGLSVRCVKD